MPENAILRNLLAETLRVYEAEHGLAPVTVEPPATPAAAMSVGLRGFGMADAKMENAVLRRLLAATAEAYEERQRAFRAEKQLVRHLLAATGDAVILTNASAAVTSLNPSAAELTGWSLDEARGHDVAAVVRLADEQGVAADLDLAPCLAEGRGIELAPGLRLAHRDGRTFAVGGRVAAIRGGRKEVLGAVLVLRRDLARS